MLKIKSPLNWPADEPRTPHLERRSVSPFTVTDHKTMQELEGALKRFKASNVVLSADGQFRGKINDTAVALFFDLPGHRSIAICCDLYMRQSDNIRALLKVVEGMRTIERYGGSKISQKTFTGFVALPPPPDIWKMLGISKGVGEALNSKMRREYVMDAFRTKAKEGHGNGQDMAALGDARDEALKQLGA